MGKLKVEYASWREQQRWREGLVFLRPGVQGAWDDQGEESGS